VLRDLHFTHPSPSNLYIHPTTRAPPPSNLALSSRNAYLSPAELLSAPILHRALSAAVRLAQTDPEATGGQIKRAAEEVIEEEGRRTEGLVEMEYVEVFRPDTFEGVKEEERVEVGSGEGEGWVIAGAMRCGRTRLIDNLVTGMEFGNGQEKGI
jgi:pantoate--beta-alanine ligase